MTDKSVGCVTRRDSDGNIIISLATTFGLELAPEIQDEDGVAQVNDGTTYPNLYVEEKRLETKPIE